MKSEISILRIAVKALIIFVIINLVFAVVNPPISLTLYNILVPGLSRMPFDGHSSSYSVMVDDIDIMLASHAISAEKTSNEFRVVLIGDSAVWQEEVPVPETFSEHWNSKLLQCHGQIMRFYNLGYPHPSVIKDLVIIKESLKDEPDLVLWFVTANTIMPRRVNPFITANRGKTLEILDTYSLTLSGEKELRQKSESLYDKTIIGRRSLLARWAKLQTLGVIWSATGVDYHDNPQQQTSHPTNDPPYKLNYFGMEPGTDFSERLLFPALQAGHDLAGDIPILLINEPIFIATGQNSDVMYNEFYPQWAYNHYRSTLTSEAISEGWNFVDAWNAVPAEHFLTPLHMSAEGGQIMTEHLTPFILEKYCN